MLTGRGWALLVVAGALALAGFGYGVEEFVLVALATAALLPTAAALAVLGARRDRSRLRVDLGPPPPDVSVGDTATVTVRCVNTSGVPLAALRIDRSPRWAVSYPGLGARRALVPPAPRLPVAARARRALRRAGAATVVPSLRPGRSWATAIAVPTTARGLWALDPVRLWASDPFGLVVVALRSSPTARVVVLPVVGTPAATPVSSSPEIALPQDATTIGRSGGDELSGLRPYQPGDRLNRLHWPAVARSGDLLVREFVESDVERVELYLDLRPTKVEGSVSTVAGSGCAALAAGRPVVVRASTGERLAIAAGEPGRRQLLQALAVAAPARSTSWR